MTRQIIPTVINPSANEWTPPTYPDGTDPRSIVAGREIIAELQSELNHLARLAYKFGPKMTKILQLPDIKAAFFQNKSKLALTCLGDLDSFTNTETPLHKRPIERIGQKPLLYWLYDATLEFVRPNAATSRGSRLQLKPGKSRGGPTHQWPLSMDIELTHRDAHPYIKLTAYLDDYYETTVVRWAPIEKARHQRLRYGKPVQPAYDDSDMDMESCGVEAVLRYLVPEAESKWRNAMEDLLESDEERLFGALATACKAPDDAYFVSDEQDKHCQKLFSLFPVEARTFFKEKVGKEGGPFSRGAFAECEKS